MVLATRVMLLVPAVSQCFFGGIFFFLRCPLFATGRTGYYHILRLMGRALGGGIGGSGWFVSLAVHAVSLATPAEECTHVRMVMGDFTPLIAPFFQRTRAEIFIPRLHTLAEFFFFFANRNIHSGRSERTAERESERSQNVTNVKR